MDYRDYYDVLGVSRSATDKEISSAFRKLARQYHPDTHPDDKDAESKFKAVNEAYQVLSDPEKRRKYDQLGRDWERVGQQQSAYRHTGTEEYSDFFETFFGGGGGFEDLGGMFGTAGRRRAPADIRLDLPVSLEEAFNGNRRTISFEQSEACPDCDGTGRKLRHEKGRSVAVACPKCSGRGLVTRRRTLTVQIPPGVGEGSQIRLAGEGDSTGRSDLYFVVKLQPHRFFRVQDHDLSCELPVMDYEAVLGAELKLPTLAGSWLTVRIPPGTQNGKRLRLKGQGMPKLKGGDRGDLYVGISIQIPLQLTPDERAHYEALAKTRQDQPRAHLF